MGRIWQIVVLSETGKDYEDAWSKAISTMLRSELTGPYGLYRWLRPDLLKLVADQKMLYKKVGLEARIKPLRRNKKH